VDEAVDHEEGEDADGDVDVEGVSPGVGVCEPAAEGGAEDRATTTPKPKRAIAAPPLARGEGLQHDGLGERLERPAAAPWTTRAARMKARVELLRRRCTLKMATQDMRKRLRPNLRRPVAGGRTMALATR